MAMRERIPGVTGSRLRSLPGAGLVCRAIRTWVADRMAELRVRLEYAESSDDRFELLASAREAFDKAFGYHTGPCSDPWVKMYNTCLFMEKSRNALKAYSDARIPVK